MMFQEGDIVRLDPSTHKELGQVFKVYGRLTSYIYLLINLNTGERLAYSESALIKVGSGKIIKIV